MNMTLHSHRYVDGMFFFDMYSYGENWEDGFKKQLAEAGGIQEWKGEVCECHPNVKRVKLRTDRSIDCVV